MIAAVRRYASVRNMKVPIQAWNIERNDLVLSFHSQDTPLYTAMESTAAAWASNGRRLSADCQAETLSLFAVEERFLPMLQASARRRQCHQLCAGLSKPIPARRSIS